MTAARPSTGIGDPHGATPVGGGDRGKRRKKGLLFGLLLLAALIALALLLSQCGGDDPADTGSAGSSATTGSSDGSGSASATSEPSTSPSASGPAAGGAGAAGAAGTVVAGDQSVLELAAGADPAAGLAQVTGQEATGTGVEVLAVPADEGFWVGTSDADRVWVQLTGGAGESPYQVQEGDTVDFDGSVVAHDQTFAEEVGVDEAAGAEQLNAQGQHLEVAKSAVRLSE